MESISKVKDIERLTRFLFGFKTGDVVLIRELEEVIPQFWNARAVILEGPKDYLRNGESYYRCLFLTGVYKGQIRYCRPKQLELYGKVVGEMTDENISSLVSRATD